MTAGGVGPADVLARAAQAAEAAAAADGEAGVALNGCCEALEAALADLILRHDGVLPAEGARYHEDLVRRAAKPLDGVRGAILTPRTVELLLTLAEGRFSFRDEIGARRYPRAAQLAPLAARAVQAVRQDITAFVADAGAML